MTAAATLLLVRLRRLPWPWLLLLGGGLLPTATTATPSAPRVGVITDAHWSATGAIREGAAELAVLVQVARLQQRAAAPVGVVVIGDHHGVFNPGTHRALELAVQQGVPVVRLARHGAPPARAPHSPFIDGGTRSAPDASVLLTTCLARFGPLPTDRTSPDWHATLQRYQQAFDQADA